MKKILRYFLFGLGWILGTLFGKWLILRLRPVLEELKERGAAYDADIRIRARSGPLYGDGTTDAPPPSSPPVEQPEEEKAERSINIE